MAKSSVEVYEKLKGTVGEEGAKALIEYVDFNIERTAVTKLDLANTENSLRTDMKEMGNSLQVEINNLRTEMKEMESSFWSKMKEIENSLRAEIKSLESSLRLEIKDSDYKMKLYFLGVAVLIIISNPKVIDLVGRILGVVK